MSKLSDLYAKNSSLFGGSDQNYGIKSYSMPNGGGTYSAQGGSSPFPLVPPAPYAPVATPTVVPPPTPVPPPVKKPLFTPTIQQAAPQPFVSKLINPATGKVYTSEEYTNMMVDKAKGTSGGVQSYASGAIANPDQSISNLNNSAYALNNARNDISTGATDPYRVASESGIQYTPAQLNSIEKAYAGIYDPSLADVFSKIDLKQKEAANALQQKNDMEKLSQQHKYAMAEKQAPTYADSHAAGLGTTGAYVAGANPAVDAWAQGIVDGSRKITDIPASQKGMRDAVQLAVVSGGNQMNGKPTTTELGKAALENAKALMTKVDAGTGMGAVGASRFWAAGAVGANMPGTPAYGLSNDFNAIKSQLSLDAVKFLKGQGQVSDAERALLAQAATKLNLSQSETEFKQTLQQIINKLETGSIEGNNTGGSSNPQTMVLNGQTLTLQSDGTYE